MDDATLQLLQQLLKQYPWVLALGPLMGFFVRWLKQEGRLTGFRILGAATGIGALLVGSYGVAVAWTPREWTTAPLGVLLLVALSNLTAATTQHAVEAIEKNRNGG